MSRDIPIIFSGAMVRALLLGHKSMTRRLADREVKFRTEEDDGLQDNIGYKPGPWRKVKPGDRLYVRENWAPGHAEYKDIVIYQADGVRGAWMYDGDGGRFLNRTGFVSGLANPELRGNWIGPPKKWRPCIHMPRKFSRLTLEVTAVKIHPVQKISAADAIAEGIQPMFNSDGKMSYKDYGSNYFGVPPRESFMSLWKALHGSESWYRNPQVIALSFKVHHQNIDSMEKTA